MITRFRQLWHQFFRRARTINKQPLNKVSLIVIILVDLFILVNVFSGLHDISRWHLSPTQAFPCYSEWQTLRGLTKDKDYSIVRSALSRSPNPSSFRQTYQQIEVGHLGKVSPVCLDFGGDKDQLQNSDNQRIVKAIEQRQANISSLEQSTRKIRAQYDSTLLERIAGQPRDRSINPVAAEKAKDQIEENDRKISVLKSEMSALKRELLVKTESANFLSLVADGQQFKQVETGYRAAAFWYPSLQLIFQLVFLLPLILVALVVNRFAERRGYGLIALISWHLLAIFFIPLLLKFFEFLQVGALFQFLADFIQSVFGGLLFLLSYLYILFIPLIGFGIIKAAQRFVLNPKVQAAKRVQSLCCVRCGKKLRSHDSHCPYCGYHQYSECSNCHQLTYQHLPYCNHCGHSQEPEIGVAEPTTMPPSPDA
jgi:hypothetical protein